MSNYLFLFVISIDIYNSKQFYNGCYFNMDMGFLV